MTIIIDAKEGIDYEKLEKAASILREGGLVAFPTETVYGLGANALLKDAVDKIFWAKGRPQDNPLIVHISSKEMLGMCAEITDERVYMLIERFWPGPLTIVLPKKNSIPDNVTAGLSTVGVRMPANKIALELIRLSDVPVAAPSANVSGKPSPTEAKHVIEDLMNKVDVIIDGGKCSFGLESTVVDLSGGEAVILRPGAISYYALKEVLGNIEYSKAVVEGLTGTVPRSPGMKYKHYAPDAKLIIVKGRIDKRIDKINEMKKKLEFKAHRVGILCFYETAHNFDSQYKLILGSMFDAKECGRNLFSLLRKFNQLGVDYILCEWGEFNLEFLALENRLYKAAANNIVEVL
ncbi:Sua5/YciO/YrdC/YwlC family protein [Caldicellulosiruptor owensensis OL]|uniref:Threonylcarbamoyl-AMP synthase n=1 Tax=Caldicellulosiruptor owensensis (strain ATCC 700167 / DSM 13100 / OL) TaxID=632518 RepID=E4Q6G1_CALOW|nr:L-threonylcarbamoyladenylate synthase [Caldicellulosiruptor owensensis]ADQ04460.1 Sua5/YciO/YrdC/YwlC family protein [Caldicellulosiruptor owensensis OL]